MDKLLIIINDIFNQIHADPTLNDAMHKEVEIIIKFLVQHACKFIYGNIVGLLT